LVLVEQMIPLQEVEILHLVHLLQLEEAPQVLLGQYQVVLVARVLEQEARLAQPEEQGNNQLNQVILELLDLVMQEEMRPLSLAGARTRLLLPLVAAVALVPLAKQGLLVHFQELFQQDIHLDHLTFLVHQQVADLLQATAAQVEHMILAVLQYFMPVVAVAQMR
jgi:hypothetical protein